jgi:hypothetical protein
MEIDNNTFKTSTEITHIRVVKKFTAYCLTADTEKYNIEIYIICYCLYYILFLLIVILYCHISMVFSPIETKLTAYCLAADTEKYNTEVYNNMLLPISYINSPYNNIILSQVQSSFPYRDKAYCLLPLCQCKVRLYRNTL